MKRGSIIGLFLMTAVWPGTAFAGTGLRTGGIPVALNLFIMAGAVACLVIAVRLFMLVKGGALARGWQLLVVSFVTLTGAQFIILADSLGIFAIPFDVAGVLYLATVVLWFFGLVQTRKVLE